MKRIKVATGENDIYVECPHCDNWESMGIDDPRENLDALPIIGWYEEEEFDISMHECTSCQELFEVEWDYNNKN